MRPIDADALKKKISDVYENKNIYQMIDEIPTVDAVPVVRCKECKHYKGGICFFTMRRHGLHDNWFCADGERRDSENG